MGRFSPGPYQKGVPKVTAGENQKGGPRAQFGKRLSHKTDDRDTYGAGEMGIKKEDQSEMGSHGFRNQETRKPVGDPASYGVKEHKGPGVPHQPKWDNSNEGKQDDDESVGPYTRSDRQGLLNNPKTGLASEPPGAKQAYNSHKKVPDTKHKPQKYMEDEPSGEWPLRQKKVAAHLRTEQQFRGK